MSKQSCDPPVLSCDPFMIMWSLLWALLCAHVIPAIYMYVIMWSMLHGLMVPAEQSWLTTARRWKILTRLSRSSGLRPTGEEVGSIDYFKFCLLVA